MHQFQTPEPDRMTDAEAQEVMRLLSERRQQQEEKQGLPSVHDVAALASSSVDDVRSALADIRARAYVATFVEPSATSRQRRLAMPVAVGLCAFAVFLILCLFTVRVNAVSGTATAATPVPYLGTPAPAPNPDTIAPPAPVAIAPTTGGN